MKLDWIETTDKIYIIVTWILDGFFAWNFESFGNCFSLVHGETDCLINSVSTPAPLVKVTQKHHQISSSEINNQTIQNFLLILDKSIGNQLQFPS